MSSSFIVISRNRPQICKDTLINLLKCIDKNDEIVVLVHHSQHIYSRLQRDMKSYKNVHFEFINYDCSLSYLWNYGIKLSVHDHVFIVNDKARPSIHDIVKSKQLNDDGYGLVGLFRFGFFSFYKDLIYRIGWFDQRFVKMGYEDTDFYYRLYEHDIAVYLSEELYDYVMMPSTGGNTHVGKYYFIRKMNKDLLDVDYYPEDRKSYYNPAVQYLPYNLSEYIYPADLWVFMVCTEYEYKGILDVLLKDGLNAFLLMVLSMSKLAIEKFLLKSYIR